MTYRRFIVLAVACLLAGLAGLSFAGPANAQTPPACPDMPPDLVSATDAAIETREQGQRDVTICLAVTGRLDLSWWGVWAVLGTLWAGLAGGLLLRAFRFWRE